LSAITASLDRLVEKGGSWRPCRACNNCSSAG
jgi:hypothetical protein